MKKKWIVTLAAASLFASTSVGVYAGSNLQQIKAFLDPGIKFKVNGQSFQPTNDKGAVVLPIIYNGATYLPVKAVSSALHVAVAYDPATKLISLGEKVDGTPIAKGFQGSYHTTDPDKTVYKGKDYKDVYFDDNKGSRSSAFTIYPKGKYQKLYLQVAAIGEDITEFFVQDTDTNIKLKYDTIKVEDGLKTIEVDIGGVNDVYINASIEGNGAMFIPLIASYYK